MIYIYICKCYTVIHVYESVFNWWRPGAFIGEGVFFSVVARCCPGQLGCAFLGERQARDLLTDQLR